jgi:hypothetical protein
VHIRWSSKRIHSTRKGDDVERRLESEALARDEGGLRALDTRELDWQEHDLVDGAWTKPLSYDAAGEPTVGIVFYPAGRSAPDFPGGIYHKDSREFAYFFGGELPHWEFGRVDDAGALVESFQELVVFKEGFYMDRRPMTVHGLGRESSRTGSEVLTWRTSRGTFVSDDAVEEHTVRSGDAASPGADQGVAYDTRGSASERAGVVTDWADLTILDTRAMTWAAHPRIAGARIKVLSSDAAGHAIVSLTWMPPERPHGRQQARSHHSFREFVFVLDGELRLREFEHPTDSEGELLIARKGYYLDRAPGSVHCVDQEPSATGCLLLSWRTLDAVFVNERDFHADRLHPSSAGV